MVVDKLATHRIEYALDRRLALIKVLNQQYCSSVSSRASTHINPATQNTLDDIHSDIGLPPPPRLQIISRVTFSFSTSVQKQIVL
mmetsp:Transcript_1662/g.3264  ORF Transcript_1662/g.3264 Transcript_1662/m.3264 type:complete len:85 (+) Transcript_1662:75-329(+)